METLQFKNELQLFVESASNETLQNFLTFLESREEEDHQLCTDLNRILDANSDMKIKLNQMMVDYK